MVIFKNTFKRMLTLKSLIIYFVLLVPIILGFTALYRLDLMGEGSSIATINSITDQYLAAYFMVTFMWVLGTPFLIMTVTRGASLIQQEIEDDTLVLLVSKPITRLRILMEKWLASFAVSLIIGLISIMLNLTLYIFVFKVESTVIGILMTMIPSLILYLLFINFIFTSISMVVTAFLKRKTRSVIIMIILIMIMQAIFPMFKAPLLMYGVYEKYNLYIIDLNYQFGLIYYYFVSLFSPVNFTPVAQMKISAFMGIFSADLNSNMSDPDLGFISDNFGVLKFFNPLLVFLFWTVIGSVNMYWSYNILKKKDIS